MPSTSDTHLPPRYENVRPIARGGMGAIFRATDSELGRDVAVKVLAARFVDDAGSRARFTREALAAARVSSSPHIATIYDVAEHEGRPLIVMEYVSGGSLDERITGDPLPVGQVLGWLSDAAAALDSAHAAGVVHRDVKPANLLLDDADRVKVADFGIASAAGLASLTQTGTILGTAGYLSPEQARGERATAASDRYSLAVVAWELLTSHRPFASATPTAEAAAHAHAPVPSIHAANPQLPVAFDEIFRRALAKDPAERYATACEFVLDLRHAVHEDAGDTGWVEPTWPTRLQHDRKPRPDRSRPDRSFRVVAVLALLLGGGGILAAILLTGHSGGSPTARTIVRTVTGPGQTVRETVTVRPTTTATAAIEQSTAPSGAALNNAGFTRMQKGDYAGALRLLEPAVQKLRGTGSSDEAYADFNLAYTRFALGRCDGVLDLLDRSEAIQGYRVEIKDLRHRARKSCGR
jgi:eukaryotic-like serine/threonine-protein kinase